MFSTNWYDYSTVIPTEKLYAYFGNSMAEFGDASSDYNLTEEQTEDLYRTFTLLDKDGDGVIEIPELELLLISLGRLPFDDNLAKILSYSGAQGCEDATGMDFRGFKNYLIKQLVDTTNEDELRKAFQIFDTNPPTGKLNVKEFRHILKTVGMMLTDDEIDFLYKESDYWMLKEKDTIEYENLISKLLDKPYDCKFLNY